MSYPAPPTPPGGDAGFGPGQGLPTYPQATSPQPYPGQAHQYGGQAPPYGLPQYAAQAQPVLPPSYPYASYYGPVGPALADRGSRFGARLLDLVFWFLGYFALGAPIMVWIDESGGGLSQLLLIGWLVTSLVLYFPACIARFGSTLGKRICGVRIVRCSTGGPVGFWRAAGREAFSLLGMAVPILSLLDPLWCCWDKPLQQCLHDKTADTVAVER